ncbi:lprB protein [Mycobacterium sp. SWH-M1]|nr:lprB protein [Mycobacterium sp. SWH-M1]
MTITRALAGLGLAFTVSWALVACGGPAEPAQPADAGSSSSGGFRSADCNGISDSDVAAAAGGNLFTRAVVSDTGCFWQENSMIGDVGAGMGISTWWYRGSDMDTERQLEQQAGRTLTELSLDGNKGFKAYDDSACSIYVAKGGDVITWSIQTLNSETLPDLCTIVGQLAQLSQDRVN